MSPYTAPLEGKISSETLALFIAFRTLNVATRPLVKSTFGSLAPTTMLVFAPKCQTTSCPLMVFSRFS